ncbi:external alternative NAD(P)H-ubiquinone oxidoreductase B2, mitochondrial-like isoform X1 [Vitis riparia]|uniref:external alternative NAD(P)H-ubiquinone oxidoreductase B2, mitochondrial-like isoform X1 n=1 Tax=Vitis riparia TaxID=96939 RepID=UPI00155A8AE6|nr:external alternative NAD(P)H-ubiquinone oxidoreductase B2, mitochondrial-like isoform X1 [Vitis riparia]
MQPPQFYDYRGERCKEGASPDSIKYSTFKAEYVEPGLMFSSLPMQLDEHNHRNGCCYSVDYVVKEWRLSSFSPNHMLTTKLCGGGLLAYSESKSYPGVRSLGSSEDDNKKKRVVVLGTGWAGTSFLKNLNNSSYDVQVVSPRNYFAFTPLLPSVTCGSVEARSIVEPIRNIVKKKNVEIHFWEAECIKIDAENKKVYCKSSQDTNLNGEEEFVVDYDYLVIAMGARANTFNTPGVVENCHFLKEVEDAQRIRRSVIDCFERASLPNLTDEERKRILHFVVVGGGPTGVEFSAELHDFVNEDLVKLYPTVKDLVKITLLEAGDHILNMFDKRITAFAEDKFHRDGIDVKTGSMVVKVSDKEISTKERGNGNITSIPYGMAVWSTGIGTRPVIMDFMKQIGQTNRRALATDEWLRVEGRDSVYALGDCATINQRKVMEDISAIFSKADNDNSGTLTVKEFQEAIDDICERYPQVELYLKNKQMHDIVDLLKDSKGDVAKESIELDIEGFKSALSQVDSQMKNLPATAQVAAQQGAYLASCFNRMEECEQNPEGPLRFRGSGRHRFHPFRYKHFGQFAPLGGEQTAAQLPGDWVSIGHSSQWLWYSVYASKLVSWRTRALVISDWTRRFVFGRDSSRI